MPLELHVSGSSDFQQNLFRVYNSVAFPSIFNTYFSSFSSHDELCVYVCA